MHIDWWTLALQTVNVLVLIWILARFFFRPVVDIVAKRQEEANKLLADAAAARQEAADDRADADKARAEIGAERDRLIAEARKSARIGEGKSARAIVAGDRETPQRGRSGDRPGSNSSGTGDHRSCERTLRGNCTASAWTPSVKALPFPHSSMGSVSELRALSSEARASFTSAAAADHAIEVVTAAPLSKEETAHVRDALKAVFGSELPFEFRS